MHETTKAAILALATEQMVDAEKRGIERYGARERVVTHAQEFAFRLCHQDHFGLSKAVAADIMGIDIRCLYRLLAKMRLNAPQVFPILPPKVARVYKMFIQDRMTIGEIAEETGTGIRNIQLMLRVLYDDRQRTGLYFPERETRRLAYREWMDNFTKEKF
jgi:hypothetical protein